MTRIFSQPLFLITFVILNITNNTGSFMQSRLFGQNINHEFNFADRAEISKQVPEQKRANGDNLVSKVMKNQKIKLTVDKVVDFLIKNNTDVKKLLLEYRKASSDLISFKSKYDHNLYANGNYSYSENPNKSSTIFYGTSTETKTIGFGIKKKYNTGTSVSLGMKNIYQNIEGAGLPGLPIGGSGYETGIKIEVKQELLKNFFGYAERLSEKKINNIETINKQIVQLKLAGLLVDALIGYWNVAIAEETLETGRINLNSTEAIRNLIMKKSKLGLSENEDIIDWNGKVLQSRNNYDKASKLLFDARLNIIRTLDLDSGLDIEIGKTFTTTPPSIYYEEALKDAFSKRIDWNNQIALLKNAELEYKIAYSELMPSLNLSLSAGNKDYDKKYEETFNDLNREYAVGFELTHPLENRSADVRMRNAEIDLQKMKVELKALEKTIRDEIASLVKECEVNYKIYEQTKKSSAYAQEYYNQVFRKFKRARYSALELKAALDGFIFARQEELQSLINYNISLLKTDMARNIIFENLNIDIDEILKKLN